MGHTILQNRPQGFRASGIVIRDKKILLMRQICRGEEFYNLPGGGWEIGEMLEETCKREILEEFSINVVVGKLVYILDSPRRINFVFACEYESGDIKLGGPEKSRMTDDDQYFVEWIDLSKLNELNIAPTETRTAISRYMQEPESPTFFISRIK